MELNRTPLFHLVRSASSWTDDARIGTAVTALLVADTDVETHNAIFKGVRTGRYDVDARLLVDLYAMCPMPARVRLVSSTAFGFLEPASYERRFLETYRSRRLTASQRRGLTDSLRTYLWRHPERLDRFAPLILDLMRGSRWNRVRGLYMAKRLSSMAENDQEIVKRSLRDRMPEVRMTAHNLLCEWVKRKAELSADLRAFCMSSEVRELASDRYKRDANVDVQTCAYYFLKAREPRAGHKPPKGMPVPPPRRKRRARR